MLRSFRYPGLTVCEALDPEVAPDVLGAADLPDYALPFSIVIANETPQVIVAYATTLHGTDQSLSPGGGRRSYHNVNFNQYGGGMEIPPGTRQLVSPHRSQRLESSSVSNGPRRASNMRRPGEPDITASREQAIVSLELVVFEDGTTVGEDRGNSVAWFNALLDGQREAAEEVERELALGITSRQLAEYLNGRLKRFEHLKSDLDITRVMPLRRFAMLAESEPHRVEREARQILARTLMKLHPPVLPN